MKRSLIFQDFTICHACFLSTSQVLVFKLLLLGLSIWKRTFDFCRRSTCGELQLLRLFSGSWRSSAKSFGMCSFNHWPLNRVQCHLLTLTSTILVSMHLIMLNCFGVEKWESLKMICWYKWDDICRLAINLNLFCWFTGYHWRWS